MEAYQAALERQAGPIGADRVGARQHGGVGGGLGTARPASSASSRSRSDLQTPPGRVPGAAGHKPGAALEPRHLLGIFGSDAETPAQANALRNVLRLLLQYAFERGWREGQSRRDVKRLRYVKKPYPAWTEGDIAAFEARWPRGSRARLALALLLYTGQRRDDVIRMGPQHVRGGVIVWRQQKPAPSWSCPCTPSCAPNWPPRRRPPRLSRDGARAALRVGDRFYNWFKDCAAKAGVARTLSPHGLRKATRAGWRRPAARRTRSRRSPDTRVSRRWSGTLGGRISGVSPRPQWCGWEGRRRTKPEWDWLPRCD
jgi:integrase